VLDQVLARKERDEIDLAHTNMVRLSTIGSCESSLATDGRLAE
jgi:hypothetical protein